MELIDVTELGLGRWRGRNFPKLVRPVSIIGLSIEAWEDGEDEENGHFIVILATTGENYQSEAAPLQDTLNHFNAIVEFFGITRADIPSRIREQIPVAEVRNRRTAIPPAILNLATYAEEMQSESRTRG